ncbi:unnamed protein product [Arctia plantaginis]|uniref:Uncharacterized protein n=1 Tax=Arctia plantaginis TaxID=874455 RepID=A0A8S1B2F4_ARCPL|nr:unnamed protein product [Arctia plantaginis]
MVEESDDEELMSNSDSEIIRQCEQELKEMDTEMRNVEVSRKNTEKRKEREEESNDEEFITVTRRKPKRLIRSNSKEISRQHEDGRMEVDEKQVEEFKYREVCVSSADALPKQMAFARLLRDQNIKNILRLKYKSPFRVIIRFDTKEDAESLLKCKKIDEMGYRRYLTNESIMSFGIIKGVDVDLDEKDIFDILESNTKILSVKRLKRISPTHNWVDSESNTSSCTVIENGETYSSIVAKNSKRAEKISNIEEQVKQKQSNWGSNGPQKRITINTDSQTKSTSFLEDQWETSSEELQDNNYRKVKQDRKGDNYYDWIKLFLKVKNIILSANSLEEKNLMCFKTICNEVWDAALEHGMMTLNNGAATRVKLVEGILRQTSPDISLVSANIATMFSWVTLQENLGSDHLLIKISMNFQQNIIKHIIKRNFKIADWIWNDILLKIHATNLTLQTEKIHLGIVVDLLDSLVNYLSNLRDQFDLYLGKAKKFANIDEMSNEDKRPKTRSVKLTRNEGSSQNTTFNACDSLRIES